MEKIATPNALKEEEYICLPTEISTAAIAGNIGVNMRFCDRDFPYLKKVSTCGEEYNKREKRREGIFLTTGASLSIDRLPLSGGATHTAGWGSCPSYCRSRSPLPHGVFSRPEASRWSEKRATAAF